MVKVENFPNAYKEVYEILKSVPQEDLDKIPKNSTKLDCKTHVKLHFLILSTTIFYYIYIV